MPSFVVSDSVTVTTIADGSATAYSTNLTGRLWAVAYVKTDFATGVDFTITTERENAGVWTEVNVDATKRVRPRELVDDQVGANIAATYDYILLENDRVKIVIANGGDSKTGTFRIYVV